MTAYYNEFDPYAAQWLRNLIAAGHIADGVVDDRSIEDIQPGDLRGFTQCHFFAGVGVWSLALRRAGWPDDRPVWTGSCPCQPFSSAGQGSGFADERHLWPAFYQLICEYSPAVVLGEQVASRDAEPWLDLVSADLEGLGFAFGAIAFPSAGVGATHIRDRTYWVADAGGARLEGRNLGALGHERSAAQRGGATGGMADAHCSAGGQGGTLNRGRNPGSDEESRSGSGGDGMPHGGQPGPANGLWAAADWLLCRDGRWRPVEPGTFPLVNGAPARVGRLRAYGNAINAEAARVFIEAVMECLP